MGDFIEFITGIMDSFGDLWTGRPRKKTKWTILEIVLAVILILLIAGLFVALIIAALK